MNRKDRTAGGGHPAGARMLCPAPLRASTFSQRFGAGSRAISLLFSCIHSIRRANSNAFPIPPHRRPPLDQSATLSRAEGRSFPIATNPLYRLLTDWQLAGSLLNRHRIISGLPFDASSRQTQERQGPKESPPPPTKTKQKNQQRIRLESLSTTSFFLLVHPGPNPDISPLFRRFSAFFKPCHFFRPVAPFRNTHTYAPAMHRTLLYAFFLHLAFLLFFCILYKKTGNTQERCVAEYATSSCRGHHSTSPFLVVQQQNKAEIAFC